MNEQIPAVVLDLNAGDTRELARFSTRMINPVGYASAGSKYEGPHRFSQIILGIGAALIVCLAVIGALASCRG